MTRRPAIVPLLWLLLAAAAPPVTFTPLEPRFEGTAGYYRQLWHAEGPRIMATLERVSGFAFPDRPLEIILRDGRPMTGYGCSAIRLRGTYMGPTAVGTLIHELGHCLAAAMPRSAGLDEHRLLYLFLYDVWTDLYGSAFADRMVSLERRITTGFDYDGAWTWALAMTREERQTRLRALRGPSRDLTKARAGYPSDCLLFLESSESWLRGRPQDPAPQDAARDLPDCQEAVRRPIGHGHFPP